MSENLEAKVRMREKRLQQTSEEKMSRNLEEKIRLREKRLHQTSEEKIAENLDAKIRMREMRKNYTIEEKAVRNSEAKIRMRNLSVKLTDEGKQNKKDKNRERMRKSRMENYFDENDSDQKISSEHNSDDCGDNEDLSTDIVKKINEENRKNKEKHVLSNEKRSESGLDECICDIDINCPYCAAQHEAEKCCYTSISKEEKERFDKEEMEEYKSM